MPDKNPHKAKTVGEWINPFDTQSKYKRIWRRSKRASKKMLGKSKNNKKIQSNCKYKNGKWVCNKW